jgi:hypothetical protein
MRKFLNILLALTFIFYIGGLQVMYWVKMYVCKQQSASLIQTGKLQGSQTVQFTFTPSEYNSLSWTEQNKEFTYIGERYDIASIQYFSDKVMVRCYTDKEETELADAFSGFIKKMFSSPQTPNEKNHDIAGKIYKEYLHVKPLVPSFFDKALVSVKATCVLVNTSAAIENIWRPPCASMGVSESFT